jgi:hypothetical protein
MTAFVDLLNHIISYDGKDVSYVVDDDDLIWFSAKNSSIGLLIY